MTPTERRANTISVLRWKLISTNKQLPLLPDVKDVPMKSAEEISRRAIAAVLSEQAAQGILAEQDVQALINENIAAFGIQENFFAKERKALDGTCTAQEAIELTWNAETYSALLWVLGYTKDLLEKTNARNYEKNIMFLGQSKDLEDFISKSKLRDKSEILDGLDILYMCHWACVEKELNPKIKTRYLNSEIVAERRKALEWVFSEETDWDRISLDT